ncbi:hypothetical protein BDY21DRAFT_331354 [Lineolata rhizophorae]|uniref:Peptide hydrolase n=1 Tax=Lineolata rhizophorae TaxID=578093 RepID=A0A6A6PEK6_9PEZI|nr:hypothetical protein BDY21DRAFT_331354 [Lineolata rhizophorae]
MRTAQGVALVSLAAGVASARSIKPVEQLAERDCDTCEDLPLVSADALISDISEDALLEKSQTLEDFAYSYPDRNRLAGSEAHNDTVDFLYDTLVALDYYDVYKQPFNLSASMGGTGDFFVNEVNQSALIMDFSPNGTVAATVVPVDNLGCDPSDYPEEVDGAIALISRGECEFGVKSALAGAAGALAAVIYNNVPGELQGTLGEPPGRAGIGDYVATVGIDMETGEDLVEQASEGDLEGIVDVLSYYIKAFTNNVIAQSKCGDQDDLLMLGAHTDSVAAGPGINDNGSGSIGILEVAIQLAKYGVNNAVRFGWWSGEEEGLLGSTYYVSQLTDEEIAKIRLYLNFDMIASPNYVYGIYDGDGDAFNMSGPAGSAEAEALFEDFFAERDIPSVPMEFSGRSDYGPFIDVGVAAGGLFTGAEVEKTAAEAADIGGEAGVAYDPCYHSACDNVTNLAMDAFVVDTEAIASAVATYALSWESLPPPSNATAKTRKARRDLVRSAPGLSMAELGKRHGFFGGKKHAQ